MPGHFRPGPECGPGFPAEHLSGGFPASSLRSGAALPEYAEGFIRPFISAYWAWSGSISALKDDVYYAVKNVLDTDLTPPWFAILFWACMLRAALRPPTRESAVRAGSFNLMRALAGSTLYTFPSEIMARRRAAKKKSSSSSALGFDGRGGGFCAGRYCGDCHVPSRGEAAGRVGYTSGHSGGERSQLSNNNYALDGTVIDRFPRGESELLPSCTKTPPGVSTLFPSVFPLRPGTD